jgi:hypothetical protein
MPDLAPNDVNILMNRIEEINAKPAPDLTSDDLDLLIAYHRRNRARKAAGEKALGHTITGAPKPDLNRILNLPMAKPKTSGITRRI